jgi:enoyl-[acyl-carrier protein] reductase II
LRTERTTALEKITEENIMSGFGVAKNLLYDGAMEAATPLPGGVSGRIDSVKPVKDILDETRNEFITTLKSLAAQNL